MTKQSYHFYRVFVAACLGMLLFGMVMLSLGSTLPYLSSRFQMNDLDAGSLASLLPGGLLLGSLIFGPVVDRFSYRHLLVTSTLLIIGGMWGIAKASGLGILQFSFFFIGLGGGAINGGTNALVADISENRGQGGSANLSLLGVFFGLGALTVPSLIAFLSRSWSYEQILLGLAAGMIFPLVYFLIIGYPLPKQNTKVPLKNTLELFRNPYLLILGFTLFFQSAFEGIYNNWTTTFLQRTHQYSEAEALSALSIYVTGITVTRILLAGLLRVMREKLAIGISMALLFTGALIFSFFSAKGWIYLGAALLGIGTAAVFPVILGYVSQLYKEMRGSAFSVVIFIAVGGNILVNFLMGVLSEYYGINIYRWVLLFCVLMIALVFSRYRTTELAENSLKQ